MPEPSVNFVLIVNGAAAAFAPTEAELEQVRAAIPPGCDWLIEKWTHEVVSSGRG